MSDPIMHRVWAMPNADTFSVKPIGEFVQRYLLGSQKSIDPFARNKRWATYTNDLNPKTSAEYHMRAEEWLPKMAAMGLNGCDLAILDMPYSPRQISECYKEAGLTAAMTETQNAKLYSAIRELLIPLLAPNAIVLSFGWNSSGMGKKHGFEIIELMLCCHGGAHNDTICLAEQRI